MEKIRSEDLPKTVQITFKNGFTASICNWPTTILGRRIDRLEIAALDPYGNFVQEHPWNDDVIRFKDGEELMELLQRIQNLK